MLLRSLAAGFGVPKQSPIQVLSRHNVACVQMGKCVSNMPRLLAYVIIILVGKFSFPKSSLSQTRLVFIVHVMIVEELDGHQ